MNFIIEFAINIILGLLQQVVKNPAKKVALQNDLIGVATSIAETYGYTLVPPSSQWSPSTSTQTAQVGDSVRVIAPVGTKKIV
jgi:hypothetical protein